MRVVAKKGFSATLNVGKKSLNITQFQPVDLSPFTEEQLTESNLESLLENGWIEEYVGQKLPSGPQVHTIPVIKSALTQGQKETQATLTVARQGDRVATDVAIDEALPDALHKRVQAEKQRQEDEAKRHVDNVKKVSTNDDVDKMPQMRALDINQLQRKVVIGGREVADYKFPAIKKDDKENTAEDKQ